MKTLPLLTLAGALLLSGPSLAGSTPWFDRDNPGGSGDYETTSDLLRIECQFTANNQAITENSPVGYHCNIKDGGWCKNNVPAGNYCQDMKVRFHYTGGVTPWLDRDNPGGVGDYETIRHLLSVQCKFVAGGGSIQSGSPAGYHCSIPENGGWCKNNVPAGTHCQDMTIRYHF